MIGFGNVSDSCGIVPKFMGGGTGVLNEIGQPEQTLCQFGASKRAWISHEGQRCGGQLHQLPGDVEWHWLVPFGR